MSRAAIALACFLLLAASASAQTPQTAPRDGFQLHDTRTLGTFTIQRWVATASPEVSPAGMCECITVVYSRSRKLLTLGEPGLISAISIEAPTGQDINGDGLPDVVVTTWSGGAHCCYSTAVYSVGTELRTVLSLDTSNCGPGELADLDNNGTLEFLTCDDQWGNVYCSFAESPFPGVVFRYDRSQGEYRLATPRYAARLRDDIARKTADARKTLAVDGGKDLGVDKCTALQPVLSLMYVGLIEEGRRLLRGLYRGGDVDDLERQTLAKVRASDLWVAR